PEIKTGQTKVIRDGETTVANIQVLLTKTSLGRLTLISLFLALSGTIGYFIFRNKTPTPPSPTVIEDQPTPSGNNARVNELESRLKETEQKAFIAEKELEKAERKLEKAEQNVKAVRPPPPCPSDMVLVPAGNFYFGSDKTDPLRNDAVEK